MTVSIRSSLALGALALAGVACVAILEGPANGGEAAYPVGDAAAQGRQRDASQIHGAAANMARPKAVRPIST